LLRSIILLSLVVTQGVSASTPTDPGRLPIDKPIKYSSDISVDQSVDNSVDTANPKPWGIALYAGKAISGPLQNIINFRLGDYLPNYLLTLAVSRRIWKISAGTQLEGELQLAKNMESGGPYQINPVLGFRVTHLPWDKYLDSSFSLGNGVSYSSHVAQLELADGVDQRLLYYIYLEFAFRIPAAKQVSFLWRAHHRAGVFGLFGASGGTNYMCLGLRYSI